MSKARKAESESDLCAKHLRIGWWSLVVFLALGILLESLHGFKAGFYLDVSNETRRSMWTLAHAHGALLSLVNIAFAMTTRLVPDWTGSKRALASRCHVASLLLLPLGFFAGGLSIHGGDPGIGILLVPPGALVLIFAVYLTARGATDGGS